MRNTGQQLLNSTMLALGIFFSLVLGPSALADELTAMSNSTDETQVALQSGPEVYNGVCIACHTPPGIGGAPALGNAEAWAPRIANGMDSLIDHALNGYSGSTGIMPKKGGRVDLSDMEIISAVHYMVEQVAQ